MQIDWVSSLLIVPNHIISPKRKKRTHVDEQPAFALLKLDQNTKSDAEVIANYIISSTREREKNIYTDRRIERNATFLLVDSISRLWNSDSVEIRSEMIHRS